MIIINLTPHSVTVIAESGDPVTFPPAGPMARVVEVVGDPSWLDTEAGRVPVVLVGYADRVENLPEQRPGVVYLVSRVTAAAVADRADLVFPQGELRDDHGQIVGCRALGTFAGTAPTKGA